jgi:hypothetical protein
METGGLGEEDGGTLAGEKSRWAHPGHASGMARGLEPEPPRGNRAGLLDRVRRLPSHAGRDAARPCATVPNATRRYPATGPPTRKRKPAGDTAFLIRTAQIPFGPAFFGHPPSLALSFFGHILLRSHFPSSAIPPSLALSSPSLSALFSPALPPGGAEGGTDDPQFLALAFSRHGMRNWGSHSHPISLPAMAHRVRCGKGGQIDPLFPLRSQRRAGKRIWG